MYKQSKSLQGAVVYAQSGGPSSVINASGYGVIESALKHKDITNVLWAGNGIEGILSEKFFDMRAEDPKELKLLKQTPAAEFGSCRKKISDETELASIVDVLKKYNIRYFFYNGGNDSMDTCQKVSDFAKKVGYEMRVMGVPKTIDNDLAATDHTPGYGSAAKYIATASQELYQEAGVYGNSPIIIAEAMGRHAGWLAGASALATEIGHGPERIYLPEVAFDMNKFMKDTAELHEKRRKLLIVVSEGVKDKSGTFIAEYAKARDRDSFGHAQLGGVASFLANELQTHLKTKAKGVELGLLQRCAAHLASQTDIEEAYNAGKIAFESAVSGMSGKMVAFKCTREPKYKCEYRLVPLSDVANYEKKVPLEWITEDGNNVNDKFIKYALPLIQGEPKIVRKNGLPQYPNLRKAKLVIPQNGIVKSK